MSTNNRDRKDDKPIGSNPVARESIMNTIDSINYRPTKVETYTVEKKITRQGSFSFSVASLPPKTLRVLLLSIENRSPNTITLQYKDSYSGGIETAWLGPNRVKTFESMTLPEASAFKALGESQTDTFYVSFTLEIRATQYFHEGDDESTDN